jgi:small subunit ribosomal protein S1
MANDPQKQQDDAADVSFADILNEFESSNRPAAREPAAPGGKGRGRNKRPSSPSHRGTVVGVSGDFVLIDYGAKSEGMIPASDLRDREGQLTVKLGDSFDVSVISFDNEGMPTLSRITGPRPRDWDGLTRAFENKDIVAGRVTGMVKGGFTVDVGTRAFLPASRSGIRDAAEMEKLVGQLPHHQTRHR